MEYEKDAPYSGSTCVWIKSKPTIILREIRNESLNIDFKKFVNVLYTVHIRTH